MTRSKILPIKPRVNFNNFKASVGPMRQLKFEAIGTSWQIDYQHSVDFAGEIKQRTNQFDKNYSRFRSDSLVSLWASRAGQYDLPKDAAPLLIFYRKLYEATEGLLTPLIGNSLAQAGYDTQYSLRPKTITKPLGWDEAIEVKRDGLIVKQPVLLDFGAAGKGYLVDLIADFFKKNGVKTFCINAGGDIYSHGLEQIIGLEDPDNFDRALGTITINNAALASSAGNRRKWAGYTHFLNPKTLRSPKNVKASWVQAETTMEADGIATALFFVKPEILLETFGFEYAMIEKDNLVYSLNFKADFFS